MSTDWENLQQRLQKRSDGTIENPVLLDGLPPNANPKQIGAKLNEIANKAHGRRLCEIGNLYGFNYWLKQKFQKIIQYSKGSTDFLYRARAISNTPTITV
jgi:hypothetical protein